MSERRIGVYICYCGGNIGDYVDVEKVREVVSTEPGVIVARTAMFTCSDATQQEIYQDIQEQKLDGLVVASCSPKLHTFTFRGVAQRAELNPYQYTQVNVREQCSWTHTDDPAGATEKAIRLVRAGIARTRLSTPLEPTIVETVPKALVIGGGIAGLRAALGLSDIGIAAILVEIGPEVGGWVGTFDRTYPHAKNGRELISHLRQEIQKREDITVFTNAEVIEKSGSFGNYQVKIRINRQPDSHIQVDAGSIIVATGFDSYQPQEEEYGCGLSGVVTLPEFKQLLDAEGPLLYKGKQVKDIAYIYCVGNHQPDSQQQYCSRYCCNAGVHAALLAGAKGTKVHQYHLYRDMRTYGKYEQLYKQVREEGSLFLKYSAEEPPQVVRDEQSDKLLVTVADQLTTGTLMSIPVDLVVLVTGMVPRSNQELVKTLKIPVGRDGFYNEIHPKLRPVETVVNGTYICGSCQGPKNSAESVASGLAAVTQSAGILKKGFAELDPQVAVVHTDKCTWCGKCLEACPYEAIEKKELNQKEVAAINEALCKGCGGCVPVCPEEAIDLLGYSDGQIKAMIDGLLKEIGV